MIIQINVLCVWMDIFLWMENVLLNVQKDILNNFGQKNAKNVILHVKHVLKETKKHNVLLAKKN